MLLTWTLHAHASDEDLQVVAEGVLSHGRAQAWDGNAEPIAYSAEQVEAWCGDRQLESYLGPLAEQFMVLAEEQGAVAGFAQLSMARASVEAVCVHPGRATALPAQS